MKLAILAFTRRGCDRAEEVRRALQPEECRMYTMEKFLRPDFLPYAPPLAAFLGPIFAWAEQIVFVGSTGMAIRAIAPWVADKKTDPGVLVVDERGCFVISLLSGHIGGANALTRTLAAALGATPVITTATDVNGRFSVDDWAARNHLTIASMAAAKAVSAAILEGDVPLCADCPLGPLPAGVVAGADGALGIYIGWREKTPFATTLQLIPRALTLGVGCRRGIARETVEQAVAEALEAHRIPRAALSRVCSIDLKAHEPGLLAFCEGWGLPLTCYSAEELLAVPGEFSASEFVKSVTGVDNVCERAAMLGGNRLLVKKTARDGVTVAVAEQAWEVAF